jgi:hypothetical protein
VIKLADHDGDEDTDLDRFVKAVSNRIGKESKQLAPDRSRYNVRVNPSLCLKYVSPILLSFLENISDRFISSNASFMIGNIITEIVCGCPTPLQIALGVELDRKKI